MILLFPYRLMLVISLKARSGWGSDMFRIFAINRLMQKLCSSLHDALMFSGATKSLGLKELFDLLAVLGFDYLKSLVVFIFKYGRTSHLILFNFALFCYLGHLKATQRPRRTNYHKQALGK